ncbi:hypothetical protein E2C00_17615 [Streptomyces sp. WAC05374]|nr:hypothetical protein EF905_16130 [Streptomyces sp. WAC05374]TDF54719.1 hypothetical protein E2C00_17615 [Streptomyces sp. WAC05374]TDF56355.1 hypothetical protein E2C02_13070 [Streptomyces sp. WAC05374]
MAGAGGDGNRRLPAWRARGGALARLSVAGRRPLPRRPARPLPPPRRMEGRRRLTPPPRPRPVPAAHDGRRAVPLAGARRPRPACTRRRR